MHPTAWDQAWPGPSDSCSRTLSHIESCLLSVRFLWLILYVGEKEQEENIPPTSPATNTAPGISRSLHALSILWSKVSDPILSYILGFQFRLSLPNTFQTLFLLLKARFISILIASKIFRSYLSPTQETFLINQQIQTGHLMLEGVNMRGSILASGFPSIFQELSANRGVRPKDSPLRSIGYASRGAPPRLWRESCVPRIFGRKFPR